MTQSVINRISAFAVVVSGFRIDLFAGDRRAVAQRAQLGPGICGWTRHAEAAVGAGHNVFPGNEFSERVRTIVYQFRVLGEVRSRD
jgi:hypothetical protein